MTVIQIKKSSVAGKVPDAADLAVGELAVNLADKKLYTKDADGDVISLGGDKEVPSGDTPPTGNEVGDLWFEEVSQELYYWNGTTWKVVATVNSLALTELFDVTIAGAVDGQVLSYDNASGNWVNVSPASLSVDVDLAYDAASNTVTNSAGDNAVLTVVDADNAGLMEPADKTKLDGLEVNDATVTVNDANGDEVGTFTVNQADDSVIALPAVPVSASAIEPTGANHGDIWVDTGECPPELKVYSDPLQCPDDSGWNKIQGGGGGGGGGTAVDYPPANLPGGSLTLQPATVSSTSGKIEFSIDGVIWSDSVGPSTAGDVVQCRWTEDAHDATPHNGKTTANIKYEIFNGATYTETYTFAVDKVPDSLNIEDAPDALLGIYVESPSEIVNSSVTARCRIWGTTDSDAQPQVLIVPVNIDTGVRYATRNTSWTDIETTPGDSVLIPPGASIGIRHKTKDGPLDVTTSTIKVGWDDTDNEASDFVTTNVNTLVITPTITGGGDNAPLRPVFTGSAYSAVGGPGEHASSDWQLATDAGFANIVYESLNDTTNLTTWTPLVNNSPGPGQSAGLLAVDTNYYLRCRYRASSGLESGYGLESLKTQLLNENYVNGTQTVTMPAGVNDYAEFVVPEATGRVRFTLNGGNGSGAIGGTVKGTCKVVPGEILRVYNVSGAVYLGEEEMYSTGTCIAIAGNAGSQGSGKNDEGNSQGSQLAAGDGGGDTGGTQPPPSNGNWGRCGTGGTQSAGGTSTATPAWSGSAGSSGQQWSGGSGWFGGGGGSADNDGYRAGGGGGGSSRIQTPSAASYRDVETVENTQGTSDGTREVLFEY